MMMIAAVVAVAGVGGWYLTTPSSAPTASNELAERLVGAANAQSAEALDTSTIKEMQQGNPDAPVTVIEYASYTCPHCASFHSGNYKQLKADYIDTGKINFVYREVYFDRPGLWASAVARCAGTDAAFFGINDLLYTGQAEWVGPSRGGDTAGTVDELRKIGRLAGLDGDTLEACLQNGDKLRTLVAWYQENAEEHGVQSTPSFVINGTTYRNMAYDEMRGIIDDAAGS